MSAHRHNVILALRAEQDFEDILLYSLMTWGEAQARLYKHSLDDVRSTLADHPFIGRSRPDIREEIRSIAVGQHVFYYVVSDRLVQIVRILHQRQTVAGQFNDLD